VNAHTLPGDSRGLTLSMGEIISNERDFSDKPESAQGEKIILDEKLLNSNVPPEIEASNSSKTHLVLPATSALTTPRTTSLLDECSEVNAHIFPGDSHIITLSVADEMISNERDSADEPESANREKRIPDEKLLSNPFKCQLINPVLCSFACETSQTTRQKDLVEDDGVFISNIQSMGYLEGEQSNGNLMASLENACRASMDNLLLPPMARNVEFEYAQSSSNSEKEMLYERACDSVEDSFEDSVTGSVEDIVNYFVEDVVNEIEQEVVNELVFNSEQIRVEDTEEDSMEDPVDESLFDSLEEIPEDKMKGLMKGALFGNTENVIENKKEDPVGKYLENNSLEHTKKVSADHTVMPLVMPLSIESSDDLLPDPESHSITKKLAKESTDFYEVHSGSHSHKSDASPAIDSSFENLSVDLLENLLQGSIGDGNSENCLENQSPNMVTETPESSKLEKNCNRDSTLSFSRPEIGKAQLDFHESPDVLNELSSEEILEFHEAAFLTNPTSSQAVIDIKYSENDVPFEESPDVVNKLSSEEILEFHEAAFLKNPTSSQEVIDIKYSENDVPFEYIEGFCEEQGRSISDLEGNTDNKRESLFEKINVKSTFEDFLGEPVENLVDDLMSELYRRASEASDAYTDEKMGQKGLDVVEQYSTHTDADIERGSPFSNSIGDNDNKAADSDDALDEAVEEALDGELATEGSFESTFPLSPQSPGPIMKIFSDIKSLDEDENITNYLSKMEKDGTTEDFYVKFTPPEGASETEIERLNALVRKLALEKKVNETESKESRSPKNTHEYLCSEESKQTEGIGDNRLNNSLFSEDDAELQEKGKKEGRMNYIESKDDDELVNAFLMGSTSFTNHAANSSNLTAIDNRLKNALKLAEEENEVAEEISSTIATKDVGFFSKLAWGASKVDTKKLKLFLKAAEPIMDEASSPYVTEAQLRREAARIDLRKEFTEQIIGQIAFLNDNVLAEAHSEDTLELSSKLNGDKFREIEEIDDSDNISAFLSRMSALQDGGHFGQKAARDFVSDEAVEVDVNHGFVNKQLEPAASEDVPWWDEDKSNAEDEKWTTERAKSTELAEISSASSEEESVIERYSRLEQGSKKASSPKSVKPPRHKGRSAISAKKVSAAGTEQSQWFSRTFSSGSIDPVPDITASLSLKNPPSLFSDLEAMFEKREEWAINSSRSHFSKDNLDTGKPQETKKRASGRKPGEIEGVAAAKAIARWSSRRCKNRNILIKRPWKQPYKERIKKHSGCFNVDVFSLYEASAVVDVPSHEFDDDLWENRDVQQRFLHEKSISMSRNWFGDLLRKRGNDRYKEPVAHPKSMEMPIENLPGEGEWVDEWYTTWQQKQIDAMSRRSDSDSASESDGSYGSETYTYDGEASSRYEDSVTNYSESACTDAIAESVYTSRRSEFSQSKHSRGLLGEDDSWEDDPPECGTIQNVKLRIGERLSLVHHEHLSSLRRSMWRKKYFPRGTFPYRG